MAKLPAVPVVPAPSPLAAPGADLTAPEVRELVFILAAVGIPPATIGQVVGASEKSLRRLYPRELELGRVQANGRVANALYQKALNGDNTAMMFWLKTRAGWKESLPPEQNGQLTINIARLDSHGDATA